MRCILCMFLFRLWIYEVRLTMALRNTFLFAHFQLHLQNLELT